MAEDFKAQIDCNAARINEVIRDTGEFFSDSHPRIAEAVRYCLEAPGKRLRAALVLECCKAVAGKTTQDAETAGCAIEMVHTYSLIHDDLPAMDDDDFRRGRPSCHKQFDEATAILAGDALLTMAFELLACRISNAQLAVKLIAALAKAAGPAGMIAGQMADLEAENQPGDLEKLKYIHVCKTARMFEAACKMGALAGGADDRQIESLGLYGLKLGLGFQIADDLLDVEATSAALGKTAGKDAEQGKLTYPSLVGIERSREWAKTVTGEAIAAIGQFGNEADVLRYLARALLERTK